MTWLMVLKMFSIMTGALSEVYYKENRFEGVYNCIFGKVYSTGI